MQDDAGNPDTKTLTMSRVITKLTQEEVFGHSIKQMNASALLTSQVLNTTDRAGKTLLHIFVEMDASKVVQKLLKKKGILVNVLDRAGYTPLDYAKTDHMKSLLREKGAKTSDELVPSLSDDESQAVLDDVELVGADEDAPAEAQGIQANPNHISAIEPNMLASVESVNWVPPTEERLQSLNDPLSHGGQILAVAHPKSVSSVSTHQAEPRDETAVSVLQPVSAEQNQAPLQNKPGIRIEKVEALGASLFNSLNHKAEDLTRSIFNSQDKANEAVLPSITASLYQSMLGSSSHTAQASLISKRGTFCDAVLLGNVDSVKRLLDAGANVNAVDKHNKTALHHAAMRGDLSLAMMLVAHGAEIDPLDNRTHTPLYYAIDYADDTENEDYAVADFFVKQCGANVALVEDDPALLDENADTDSDDDEDLMESQHASAAVELIPQVDAATPSHPYPLHWAVYSGDVETVRVLLNQHNVNERDSEGRSPLWYAAAQANMGYAPDQKKREGYEQILKWLLEHGADALLADNGNESPLTLAVSWCQLPLVRVFLLDAIEKNRNLGEVMTNLLRIAIQNRDKGMVQLLREAGADVTAPNEAGETALAYVAAQLAAVSERDHLARAELEAIQELLLTNLNDEEEALDMPQDEPEQEAVATAQSNDWDTIEVVEPQGTVEPEEAAAQPDEEEAIPASHEVLQGEETESDSIIVALPLSSAEFQEIPPPNLQGTDGVTPSVASMAPAAASQPDANTGTLLLSPEEFQSILPPPNLPVIAGPTFSVAPVVPVAASQPESPRSQSFLKHALYAVAGAVGISTAFGVGMVLGLFVPTVAATGTTTTLGLFIFGGIAGITGIGAAAATGGILAGAVLLVIGIALFARWAMKGPSVASSDDVRNTVTVQKGQPDGVDANDDALSRHSATYNDDEPTLIPNPKPTPELTVTAHDPSIPDPNGVNHWETQLPSTEIKLLILARLSLSGIANLRRTNKAWNAFLKGDIFWSWLKQHFYSFISVPPVPQGPAFIIEEYTSNDAAEALVARQAMTLSYQSRLKAAVVGAYQILDHYPDALIEALGGKQAFLALPMLTVPNEAYTTVCQYDHLQAPRPPTNSVTNTSHLPFISRLRPNHLSAPVMIGMDRYHRPFVAVLVRDAQLHRQWVEVFYKDSGKGKHDNNLLWQTAGNDFIAGFYYLYPNRNSSQSLDVCQPVPAADGGLAMRFIDLDRCDFNKQAFSRLQQFVKSETTSPSPLSPLYYSTVNGQQTLKEDSRLAFIENADSTYSNQPRYVLGTPPAPRLVGHP